jgi:hypothetical protein
MAHYAGTARNLGDNGETATLQLPQTGKPRGRVEKSFVLLNEQQEDWQVGRTRHNARVTRAGQLEAARQCVLQRFLWRYTPTRRGGSI